MIRRIFTSLVLIAAVLVVAGAPADAQYQPGQPGFFLVPSQVGPGDPVTAIGTGCPRAVPVEVRIGGELVGTGVSADDEGGGFEVTFPAPLVPGEYLVEVTCGGVSMSQLLIVSESSCGFIIEGAPGSPASASIGGYQIGAGYTVLFQPLGVVVDSGIVESDPLFFQFEIPTNASPGQALLVIQGVDRNAQPLELDCEVIVSAGMTTGPLPRTGSDASGLIRAGIALAALGGLLLLATRRRTAARLA